MKLPKYLTYPTEEIENVVNIPPFRESLEFTAWDNLPSYPPSEEVLFILKNDLTLTLWRMFLKTRPTNATGGKLIAIEFECLPYSPHSSRPSIRATGTFLWE